MNGRTVIDRFMMGLFVTAVTTMSLLLLALLLVKGN